MNVILDTDLPHPFGLAIFKNQIYWTDWVSASINVADKETGKQRAVIRYLFFSYIFIGTGNSK